MTNYQEAVAFFRDVNNNNPDQIKIDGVILTKPNFEEEVKTLQTWNDAEKLFKWIVKISKESKNGLNPS